MKKYTLLLFSIIIPLLTFSQETHYVYVQEMSYSPNNLTIQVGDQVSFTHEGLGMHDVNFTTNSITFEPFNNPAEIATLPGEGQYQSEAGLMGVITFDVPGVYNYDCSMYGHASLGMVGSITVNEQGCEDDLDGILESYSYQCNDIVGEWFPWDCEDDLSVAVPVAPSGIWTIGDLCPQSCDECDEENLIIGELFNKKKLFKTIDLLGREINSHTGFQLHIYDDGSIERKYIVK